MADDPTMSPPTDRKKRYVYFDPETLSLDPISVTPAPGQPSVHPRRLVVTMPTGSVTVEQDERGVPLRMDMPGGISMVRQTEAVVSAYLTGDKFTTSGTDARQPEAKALDFAVVTAVSPTGQPLLGSPTTLVAKVTMATGSSILYTIHKVATPSKMPFGDSINDIRGRSDLSAYLANTAYVDCNDPKIVGEAREVAGARTNLYEIAVQIQEWVHQQMSPTPTMGLPRTAVEIMGDRRGVCRDYALLFTALARAAHLPTRLCAGLVGYQGRFYYHAWAESYVGGSIGWMPFDPTLDELPVDASHIPLVKGDPVSLYDLVGNIGATRVKIMRCER
jgi:transglutaminase-like putative cysteine protease